MLLCRGNCGFDVESYEAGSGEVSGAADGGVHKIVSKR
jgi:hypothetical protein